MESLLCPSVLAALIGLPPQLMLLVTLGGIFYLFRRDFRQKPNVTKAIWIPIVWLFIIASRPISAWFQILGLPVVMAGSVEEGSPVDAACFFTLMLLGLCVLVKRRVYLSAFVQDNPWLVIFFVYCFLAVLWSDFPVNS